MLHKKFNQNVSIYFFNQTFDSCSLNSSFTFYVILKLIRQRTKTIQGRANVNKYNEKYKSLIYFGHL